MSDTVGLIFLCEFSISGFLSQTTHAPGIRISRLSLPEQREFVFDILHRTAVRLFRPNPLVNSFCYDLIKMLYWQSEFVAHFGPSLNPDSQFVYILIAFHQCYCIHGNRCNFSTETELRCKRNLQSPHQTRQSSEQNPVQHLSV